MIDTMVPSKTPPMIQLRHLDMDDIYLLALLARGLRMVDVARQLRLTQSAITQRLRKIEGVLRGPIIDRKFRLTALTPFGSIVCARASQAVVSLERISAS